MIQSSDSTAHFFQFEADFVDSLRCIPMQVRMKLDTCGIKLKLHQWNQFSLDERQQLALLPCESEDDQTIYRDFLTRLIAERTGESAQELDVDPHPPWREAGSIPVNVQERAQHLGITITPGQWATLSALQRFALIKLSRSSHETSNFLPALQEFNLV